MLAAWQPLPTLGLGLEVKMDEAEVFAPIRAERRTLLLLIVIGLPLLAVGALLAARQVSRPISRLTAATRTIAAGNRDFQVPVDRDDEVGELSQAFNAMTAELAASYAGVEETVRVRTGELRLIQLVAVAANVAMNREEATRTALDLVCAYTGWPVGHALFFLTTGRTRRRGCRARLVRHLACRRPRAVASLPGVGRGASLRARDWSSRAGPRPGPSGLGGRDRRRIALPRRAAAGRGRPAGGHGLPRARGS